MDENTRSLIGVNKLVNKDNTRGDINIEDVENGMIRDTKFSVPSIQEKVTPAKQDNKYEAELRALTEQLNLTKPEERRPSMFVDLGGGTNTTSSKTSSILDFSGSDVSDVSGLGFSSGGGGRANTTNGSTSTYSMREPGNDLSIDSYDEFDRNNDIGLPQDRFSVETQEKSRHREIRNTMEEMGISTYSFEKEKREDSKSVMLEEIDFLKDELVESNYSIERIPVISQSSNFEEIESVLRMLRHKCDRIKYCDFAEQFLMVGVYALEELFDGKKSYWGYTPDLTNWSSSVQMKLRRMRYDTSQIVSQVMYDYNIGPGTRLMLELIPSAIIHSKTRRNEAEKIKSRDSTQNNDKRVLDAVERLRDL